MLAVLIALSPVVVVSGLAVAVARREHQRRALRRCPACSGSALVRVSPRPPRDQPHYRRAAIAYRCAPCDLELFELSRPCTTGLVTGEQLDTLVAAGNLPVAVLRRP